MQQCALHISKYLIFLVGTLYFMLRKAECPVWAACVAFLFLLIPKQDSSRASCDLRETDTSKHLWTLSERKVRALVQQLSLGNPSTETFQ